MNSPIPAEPLPLVGREVVLGGTRGMTVVRTLPHRDRRMVGAWCFVDHFGPEYVGPTADGTATSGMRVPPHPHTGLQTVTWLVRGEVRHRDSLGHNQLIRPGQLNLMTAGRGIAHSEESPPQRPPYLHGVQLWVALPDGQRRVEPHFAHHADLPRLTEPGMTTTVLIGESGGLVSPARAYTPVVGVEIQCDAGLRTQIALRSDFEYAVLCVTGRVELDGVGLDPGPLLYLGEGRRQLVVSTQEPARLMLLGGEPFEEKIIMWWNFIGRTHDEIVRDVDDWTAGRGFGDVTGYDGAPLAAPAMPSTPLKPRGRLR